MSPEIAERSFEEAIECAASVEKHRHHVAPVEGRTTRADGKFTPFHRGIGPVHLSAHGDPSATRLCGI
jgi:hypothetical protein